jgi:2-dehydro-3-deoxygalactonokinase
MRSLLGLDWGTSSLRGALLDSDGNVISERSFPRGISTVAAGQFNAVFNSCFADWMQTDTLCLIAGMAGSQQGWVEAPYCPCPAGFEDVAAQLAWVEPNRIGIVAGLSIDHNGLPDVMRGEETQVFGALRLLGLHTARLVLPGTHSKWVTTVDGRITDFSTYMTGEVYALLRQHSILARTMPDEDVAHSATAFERGISIALHGNGLLNTAFSVRTMALFNRMAIDALPSYLSGLVIGEELKSQHLSSSETLVLVGTPDLCERYQQALALLGIVPHIIGNQATWSGLRKIADKLES